MVTCAFKTQVNESNVELFVRIRAFDLIF